MEDSRLQEVCSIGVTTVSGGRIVRRHRHPTWEYAPQMSSVQEQLLLTDAHAGFGPRDFRAGLAGRGGPPRRGGGGARPPGPGGS